MSLWLMACDRKVMAAVEVQVISADGTRVGVLSTGQGAPILIVHPGSSGVSSWAAVADRLSLRFRVLRIARRLYAGSPRPGHTMAAEVDDVLAVAELAASTGPPPMVVGHSSGAIVALEAARTAPAAFAGMLLYEPPVAVNRPLGGDALVRARAALAAGRPGRAMAIHLREIVQVPWPTVAALRLAPSAWRRLRAFAPAQIADDEAIESLGVGLHRYAGLNVAACLLGGARSPKNLRQRLDALGHALPRAETVILRRHGHAAHLTAAIEVAWVVEDFADTVLGTR
jgi:pimeloyl-ACP methyl ester carboxylesterase